MSIESNPNCAIITPCSQVYSILDQMKELLNGTTLQADKIKELYTKIVEAEESARTSLQSSVLAAKDAVEAAKDAVEAKRMCLEAVEKLSANSTWNNAWRVVSQTANNIWNRVEPLIGNEAVFVSALGISLLATGVAIYKYRNNEDWKPLASAAVSSSALALGSYFLMPRKA